VAEDAFLPLAELEDVEEAAEEWEEEEEDAVDGCVLLLPCGVG
jgi:hypothetical protein